ncbi:MAG: tetratricopeptide repeat protein [Cyanobacteria bacterium P01_H01_bin.74]
MSRIQRNSIYQSNQLKVLFSFTTSLMACFLTCVLFFSGCQQNEPPPTPENAAAVQEELQGIRGLIEAGNFQEAFLRLNGALDIDPKNPKIHLNLAWLYLYTKDMQKALQEISTLRKLSPDLPEIDHLQGVFDQNQAQQLQQNGQPLVGEQLHKQAVFRLQKALNHDKNNHQIFFDIATSLSAIDRNQEALSFLDSGFDYIPTADLETQVNFQIAICALHAKMNMFEEAILDCEQAATFANTDAAKERIVNLIENMKLLNPGFELPENAKKLDALQP